MADSVDKEDSLVSPRSGGGGGGGNGGSLVGVARCCVCRLSVSYGRPSLADPIGCVQGGFSPYTMGVGLLTAPAAAAVCVRGLLWLAAVRVGLKNASPGSHVITPAAAGRCSGLRVGLGDWSLPLAVRSKRALAARLLAATVR